jgi:hypothetical protein
MEDLKDLNIIVEAYLMLLALGVISKAFEFLMKL